MMKAVIFDLGRVLVDLDMTRGFYGMIAAKQRSDPERLLDVYTTDALVAPYMRGEIPPEVFYREGCRSLGVEHGYEEFVEVWCDVFKPMPGMDLLVEQVAARVPVGLLSDTDALHWAYLKANFPLFRHFPNPTLSFEIGSLKPDPRSYVKAAEMVGFAPEECFFVDDRRVNVEGAGRVGMDAVVFEGAERLRAELRRRGLPV